jgi:hypothetical protein
MLAEPDWPALAHSKDIFFESRLIETERSRYPILAKDESALRTLQGHLGQYYQAACAVIERVHSSKNLSRSKMTSFRSQICSTIEFFASAVPFMARLSTDLLDAQTPAHLHHLYAKSKEDFENALEKLWRHFQTHIGRTGNSGSKINFQHLLKLRAVLDDLATACTAALAPLSAAFSMKIAPILSDRESFYRWQNATVAERGARIAQIRDEMKELIQRRQRLKTGEDNLAKMFGVLVHFPSSLKLHSEEEDDGFHLSDVFRAG